MTSRTVFVWFTLSSLLIASWFFSVSVFYLVAALVVSLVLGVPLFVLMGVVAILCFTLFTDEVHSVMSLTFLIRKLQEIANKEVLLAIPFFIVAGEIMTEGNLAKQLINVGQALFSWLPGGLAVSAVSGCVFFAAISGSSPVTLIAIGSIMVPALLKAGYDERFSIGLLTTAGSLGILIPPSIPMIIYALMVSSISPIDPTDLFLAGVVPGLMIGGLLSIYAVSVGVAKKMPTTPFSMSNLTHAIKEGIWSLLLPIIILGGIYSGIFTPTEGAAVSVVYALVIEILIYDEMKPRQLIGVAVRSMVMMGSLFLIMALALGVNHFFVIEQIPDLFVAWIQRAHLSQLGFLLLVNVFLLGVGMVMDIISAILILAPMLAPMAVAAGVDPIHMGIIFIINLEIGYLTPPVGLNLFVASTLFRKNLGEIVRAVVPSLVIMLLGLILVMFIPSLSTGLVDLVRGDKHTHTTSKTLQDLMREVQSEHR